MAEALLNGQVYLQLAATRTGYQSAKLRPYPKSSAGLETASMFWLLLQSPVNLGYPPSSQVENI